VGETPISLAAGPGDHYHRFIPRCAMSIHSSYILIFAVMMFVGVMVFIGILPTITAECPRNPILEAFEINTRYHSSSMRRTMHVDFARSVDVPAACRSYRLHGAGSNP
jgi:hypothetical protein